jgi:hypothetical protein
MLSILLAIVLFVSGSVGAVALSDQAAPGDLLYSVDRAVENIRIQMERNPEGKARLYLEGAVERLEEMQSLAERGLPERMSMAMDEVNLAVSRATEVSGSISPETIVQIMDEALAKVETDDDDELRCVEGFPDLHPVGNGLAHRYDVDYEEIMGWFCSGYGFGEIKIAYETALKADVAVEELFAMRAEGLGWGEIFQALGLIGKPGDLEEQDENELEIDDEKENRGGVDCTSADPHPKATSLAAEYGVTYEEIMEWFCQGYGFGEIKLAYSISLQAELGVEDVFDMRAGGMGWGEIMQEFNLIGKPAGTPGKPDWTPGGKPENTPGGKPDNVPGGKPDWTPGGKP